ncbi:MAG: M20/M25/M40 family metallo-hydrolase, partial [Bryobacteraceae bacterium]
RELDPVATIKAPAPGVTDDGSGTAAVMELARVMSRYRFRKTIVFIAFAAEEYGLFGSGLYAEEAAARHDRIDGVFNNDIIGSDVTGNGETTNRYVNVYSEGPEDSSSRELARYMKRMAECYRPGFGIHLIFRQDRFGRGGDHSSFNAAGYAAVRVTTPMENYSQQHTATDTFENTAPAYTALVTQANAATIASLALAPRAPEIRTLSRGHGADGYAGYDAVMIWQGGRRDPNLLGYTIVVRKTTAPDWQREIFAGDVNTYTLPSVNIDQVVLGLKAIGRDGGESPVSAYVASPYPRRKIETY